MMLGACLFAAGAWLLQQQASLPGVAGTVVLVPLLLAGVHWRARRERVLRGCARACLGLACLVAGFEWAALQAHWRLSDALPERIEGRDVRVRGEVVSLPVRASRGWRFEFEVERTLAAEGHVPRHVLLTMLDDPGDQAEPGSVPVVPGEQLELTARFRRPHGTANPHGFDVEAWLLEHGIRATGYVRPREPVRRLGVSAWNPMRLIDRWRLHIRERLQRVLDGSPESGVVVALAIGDQQSIPRERWQLYTTTGINHLVSISGLHVTLFAVLAGWLARRAWRLFPRAARCFPAPDAGAWIGLAAAAAYALLAGFAVPAQRTLWMLGTATIAGRVRVLVDPWDVLGIALATVLVADPFAVTAPGFWLSFGAVALLVFSGGAERSRAAWWLRWGRAQWALFLGLAPLLLALFRQVSLVAPLANAVAVPVVGTVVVPLTLLGAVVPWHWPVRLAAGVLELLDVFLRWLAALPLATYVQHAPVWWSIPLALAAAAWLLLPRGFPSRWLGWLGLLPLVFVRPDAPPAGHADVTLLDVGQGLAAVVRTQSSTLLFDAGPAWTADSDSGGRIVVPYLRGQGITRLEMLVVSHDDRDHTGGVASVLAAVPVSTVLTSLPRASPVLSGAGRVLRCAAGQSWSWDGVEFQILHPAPGAAGPGGRDNARSCVLRIVAGSDSLLLPADIERDSEQALIAAGAPLSSTLLVAPHHGSATSSTERFIAAVSPEAVLFPVGYRNRFGHPHDDVVSRYRERGILMVRTDDAGAVSARIGGGDWSLDRFRESRPRYWRAPAGRR